MSTDRNQVSIGAEVKKEMEGKKERVVHSERYFGRVARYFTLGYEVDETQASAEYADGVLALTLPKNGATGAQKLTIQ